ncbi:CACNA1B [Symbiodinium natans]|uniref:CACNA1B protein n=1 Tax=Symbiodinium natans TaxID=878477 RepID=A0A812RS83_9DINO|nr:CACNA1B [Symbiodinium natans]
MVFGGKQKESATPRPRRKFGAAALGGDDDSEDGEGQFHPHGFAKWTMMRQKVWGMITNPKTDWVLASMILSGVVILIVDADLTAKHDDRNPEEELWQLITNYITAFYTCIYALEMSARIYVFRLEVFKTAMLFDFLIVASDVILLISDVALGFSYQLGFLRIFRLVRVFRFVRVVGMFPELQFLVKGFISSFSAVFWGSILMWIVILMWGIIAVYFIEPVNRELVLEMSSGEECDRSCKAWASVWSSVITLCQTVVFGDSWGASAIAIIEKAPQTIFIFVGMYATVTLGVLNLIVAAIVDSGAQAREEAQEAKRRRQRNEEQKQKERQKNRLLEICKILDDDESGSLSYDELLVGFERNSEFRNAMKDYNIDRKDLDVLFRVFDETGTGVLDYQDFFNMIDSAREQASQQVLTFVRFAVMDLRQQVQAGQDMIKSELDSIKEFVVEAENSLNERLCRLSGEPAPPKKSAAPPPVVSKVTSTNNAGANVSKVNSTNSAATRAASPSAVEKKSPASISSQSAAAPKRVPSAKSVAEPTLTNNTSKAGKAEASRSPSPSSMASLKVPGETKDQVAPLQQLMKINKELLQGMRKLLDAHAVDFNPTVGGGLGLQNSESDREVVHVESGLTMKSTISLRGGPEIEKDPPLPPEGLPERPPRKSWDIRPL